MSWQTKAYTDTTHVSAWSSQVTQRFIEDRIKKKDKPATVSMRLAFVCALGNWLMKERPEWFEEYGHPTKGAKPPVQDALAPKCLDTRQLNRLVDSAKAEIATVEAEDTKKAAIKRPYRDYAILMLLIYTGIRRQEVCDLTLEQFQGAQLINVKSKGNLYRNVRLNSTVRLAIQDYLEKERYRDAQAFPASVTVFLASKSRKRRKYHGHLSPRAINRIIESQAKSANAHLPHERQFKVTPHMLRHSHAYAVLKKTKSLAYVQKRLGHQSQAYLARYTQMPVEEETQMLEELFE